MKIARIIATRPSSQVISCDAEMKVRDAVAMLAEKRIGALPVMEQGRPVGIFSERDVIICLAHEGAAALDRSVGEVMTAPAVSVDPGTSVLTALAMMTQRRMRHFPVVSDTDDSGAMCGFISIGDLVKSRIDEIEDEAQAMREYIQTA